MLKPLNRRRCRLASVFFVLASLILIVSCSARQVLISSAPHLLTDPFLQLPTENSVRVVWFTEFAGSRHHVAYGAMDRIAVATTTKLSRTREDKDSKVKQDGQYNKPTSRDIWRHEAEVSGLTPRTRIPYRVTSVREDGRAASSAKFTLASKPTPGTPLKILLTSDHQVMPMITANLQMVVETVGQVDGVFFAGDAVNHPDRASEWFDDSSGGAFFPSLQGVGSRKLPEDGKTGTTYRGGELIQHAPLFTAIGNHEVMGRFSMESGLNDQFNDAFPRAAAQSLYEHSSAILNPSNDPTVRDRWLKNNSYNTDTYEEIFTLPRSSQGGEKYYSVTFGDVRLVVLYASNMWRVPALDSGARGKYREREDDLNHPDRWGYGQHIFEPIAKGSAQYSWLQQELNSPEFKQTKYKVVMVHCPPHSLGDNIVPAYTDPVQIVDRDANGSIKAIRYEYPKQADYMIRDVVPLLESAGVQLVFYGHSHLWNRFVNSSGMHFLESSNIGNTYCAFTGDNKQKMPANHTGTDCKKNNRNVPPSQTKDYTAADNPNGLQPVIPTIAPIKVGGKPIPYIASNEITVFSIFDTTTGTISSYRFDTAQSKSRVVKFDEFKLT